jgi:hypothetical protein
LKKRRHVIVIRNRVPVRSYVPKDINCSGSEAGGRNHHDKKETEIKQNKGQSQRHQCLTCSESSPSSEIKLEGELNASRRSNGSGRGEKKRKLVQWEVQKKYAPKGGERILRVEPSKLRDLKTSGPHPT